VEEEQTVVAEDLPNPSLATTAYGETDVGRVRESNEDAFAVVRHLGLFMVADGMGGAAAGEVASNAVIQHVQRAVEDGETTWPTDSSIRSPESGPRRFIAGIHRANRSIYRQSGEDWRRRGMGTTFAGLFLLDRSAVIAHVGDSRVYRLRDGALEQMTHDHSLANHLVEQGYLRPEDVATFPRRNVITRAVGTHEHVEVDARIVDVRPGDTFLLCSDGLTGEISDAELGTILREAPSPVHAVGQLVDRALANGGSDNVTAVVVRVDGVGEPVADDQTGPSSTPVPSRSS
jgi:protein phosphatase